jgi:dissimilatory sulfite reductase (desulfoviridin) alpha/beta subunit
VTAESPVLPTEKETTMIKRHSDVVLEITAHDPDSIENDLNTAVEIAREHAVKERRHGVLVTQHGFTRYTVAISRDVPFGQTLERRELPGSSQTETEPGC